jgi:hypothetical protein
MRGRKARYTFVIEFLGGTYVHQASGESPELALCAWLRHASEEEFEWSIHRAELLRALTGEVAVPIDSCRNVWCMSGLAGDHLFLIHIVATESGDGEGKSVAEAQVEQAGIDFNRWHPGDRR